MKWILFLTMSILISCANSKENEIGQFLYVDCLKTIHVDRNCPSKIDDNTKTEDEILIKMRGVVFVDTCEIKYLGYYHFCPKCVDDKSCARIVTMAKRNENKDNSY